MAALLPSVLTCLSHLQVREVTKYRRTVYALVRAAILSCPGLAPESLPVTWDDPEWALFMGFEHERIHVETSSVLMRELPVQCVRQPQQVRGAAVSCMRCWRWLRHRQGLRYTFTTE
jgi:hypothetical protein